MKLITIRGRQGTGKSTIAKALVEALRAVDLHAELADDGIGIAKAMAVAVRKDPDYIVTCQQTIDGDPEISLVTEEV